MLINFPNPVPTRTERSGLTKSGCITFSNWCSEHLLHPNKAVSKVIEKNVAKCITKVYAERFNRQKFNERNSKSVHPFEVGVSFLKSRNITGQNSSFTKGSKEQKHQEIIKVKCKLNLSLLLYFIPQSCVQEYSLGHSK